MHIDQRLTGKGRKPFKAIDQPRRLTVDERQHTEGMGPFGKFCGQLLQHVRRQRFATPHRVLGVVVQDGSERLSMNRVCIVCLHYHDIRHYAHSSTNLVISIC